jgi:ubiquinol-cytochrome c reductase cytochrome b subunit
MAAGNPSKGGIGGAVATVAAWVQYRAPALDVQYRKHLAEYWAPKNFNTMYYFGVLAIVVLVMQLLTGIWLTMNYKPTALEAFASVEYIMRDVEWGWLIRYMHSTGASAFFAVVYLHMVRGLMYGSYQKPRELVWVVGMLVYLTMMAEAFMGYVLPFGQMSYWGAQVITSLFGAIPVIGQDLLEFIRGDFLIGDATLNRFFALHVVALPLVLLLLVVLHILALHEVGSNNPEGVDIKKFKDARGKPLDAVAFHPYYTVKDTFGAGFFLIIFAFIVFFAPLFAGFFIEYDNFVPANPLLTPAHIKPVWYFTPYYAILRAIPDKFLGVCVMGVAVMILFVIPWLDRSPVRSFKYRGTLSKVLLALFGVAFAFLGYAGYQPPGDTLTMLARVATFYYFAYFISMPFWSKWDAVKPVPDRVPRHHE